VEAMTARRRVLSLPYPPSTNHYWRHVGRRTLISREGRRYRECVCALLAASGLKRLDGRLSVTITLYVPDRRRRDIDNTQKAVLDSLAHARVFRDDAQVDELVTRRGPVTPGGACFVEIEEIV
jgi:crossover junction endodeoxyribonuclease RusA